MRSPGAASASVDQVGFYPRTCGKYSGITLNTLQNAPIEISEDFLIDKHIRLCQNSKNKFVESFSESTVKDTLADRVRARWCEFEMVGPPWSEPKIRKKTDDHSRIADSRLAGSSCRIHGVA